MPSSTPTFSWDNDDLPKREIELVFWVVRDFLRTRDGHPGLALDDLAQECLLHWWTKRSKYDGGRGASLETFLRTVVNTKLIDLERGINAQKRGGGRGEASLDQPLTSDEPDGDIVADTLPDPMDTAREAVERVSLEVALCRLSSRQKQIIAGLEARYPKSQISQILGIPRATFYDDLKRIRLIFRDEELNQFPEGSDS